MSSSPIVNFLQDNGVSLSDPVSGFMTMGYISQDITYKFSGMAKKKREEFAEKLHELGLQLRGREERDGSSHCYSWKAAILSFGGTAGLAHTLSCHSSSFGSLKLGHSKIDKGAVFFCFPSNLLP